MAIQPKSSILVLDRKSKDICGMFKKLKKRITNFGTRSGETQSVPEARGQDAKSLAEMKADAAGEKWREQAEARGEKPLETGGPKGLEPTRYGDWERAGRCVDF